MVTYQQLVQRKQFHYDQANLIWDTAYAEHRDMTKDEQKSWKHHEREGHILLNRICREFPGEVAAEESASELRLKQAKQFVRDWPESYAPTQSIELLEHDRKLISELTALEAPHEDN